MVTSPAPRRNWGCEAIWKFSYGNGTTGCASPPARWPNVRRASGLEAKGWRESSFGASSGKIYRPSRPPHCRYCRVTCSRPDAAGHGATLRRGKKFLRLLGIEQGWRCPRRALVNQVPTSQGRTTRTTPQHSDGSVAVRRKSEGSPFTGW